MATKKTFKDSMENPAELFITTKKPAETATEAGTLQGKLPKAPEGYHINPLYIENKSRRLQLLVKPSIVDKLKERAKRENTSVNDLVNILLEEALREE